MSEGARQVDSESIRVDGITYSVLQSRGFEHKGKARTVLTLRRPSGKNLYSVVRYENGSYSRVLAVPSALTVTP